MKNDDTNKNTRNAAAESKQTSRRKFIVGTAAATAAASALPVEPYAQVAGSDEIKVGVIGCGGRGSGAIRKAVSAKWKRKSTAAKAFSIPAVAKPASSIAKARRFVSHRKTRPMAIALGEKINLEAGPNFPQRKSEKPVQSRRLFCAL